MAVGAAVVVAPGLFYVDCGFGPSEAVKVIADGLNWHLWGVSFQGESPCQVKSEWLWG